MEELIECAKQIADQKIKLAEIELEESKVNYTFQLDKFQRIESLWKDGIGKEAISEDEYKTIEFNFKKSELAVKRAEVNLIRVRFLESYAELTGKVDIS